MKKLHISGEIEGGGAQKIFRLTYELFKNDSYIGAISSKKMDINFENAKTETGFLKIIKTIFYYKNYKKLKNFLDKNSVDLVHLHSFNSTLSPSILLALKNKKVIQTLHEYQIICPNASLFCYGDNKICEKCIGKKNKYKVLISNCVLKGKMYSFGKYICYLIFDKILKQKEGITHFIVPSEFTKEKMIKDGINKQKISVIENPVENIFKIDNYLQKEEIIVYFGRFSKEKNVELLIEAFRDILKIKSGVKLFLIGKGNELFYYNGLIKEFNLEKDVIIKQFLSAKELKEILKKAKISILPSRCYETFGLTIIESIYARVYPIANNIGAMKENIEKNIGKTFNSKEELKDIVIKILDNYEEYKEEIDKNYDIIVEKYSLENYKKKLLELYKRI